MAKPLITSGPHRTIAIINRKGGVAKTTTAVNLAWWLAHDRKKTVLVIDLDGQGNAAHILTGKNQKDRPGAAEWMTGAAPYPDILPIREDYAAQLPGRIYALPGGAALPRLDKTLDGIDALKNRLDPGKLDANASAMTDYSIIDCPPTFNLAVTNALVAADVVIVPTTSSADSLEGVRTVLGELSEAAQLIGEKRVLLLNTIREPGCQLDMRALLREMRAIYPCGRATHRIPQTQRATAAAAVRELLAVYSPTCGASRMYRGMAELLDRGIYTPDL